MKRLMHFLWKYLFLWNHKRFSIKIAFTPEEKEKIYKFRYQIYQNEFHYYSDEEQRKLNGKICDAFDDSKNTIILMASDQSEIVGTLRITVWQPNELPAAISEKYFLTELENINQLKIAELRLFLVKEAFRKGNLAISLFSTLYSIWRKDPTLLPDMIFADCMPGLVHFYQKLGWYLYCNNIVPSYFGIMIPIAFEPLNYERLKQNQCITHGLARTILGNPIQTLPAVKEISNGLVQDEITSISSKKFKELNFILQHIKDPLVITIPFGKTILKSNTLDYDLYWILEGSVGVYNKGCLISELHAGDLFGEMALLDRNHKRFTDVTSLTEIKILLIPRNLLHKMLSKNPHDAIDFMKILGESLSHKINTANNIICELKTSY